ncbi:MAG: hypothetical protein WAN13_10575 [Candidatus Acidiferrales bacterium]
MDGFLRAATRRVSETAQPVSVGAARGGWLSAWKIQWAFAVAATLVVSGAAYLVFFGSWGGYLRTVMHRSAAAPTTVAQSQQGAQPQSQNFPEATTSATQTAQPSTTNPPSSAKLTRNTQPVPAPAQPAAPVAPNQNAPTGPSAQTPVYEAQNPPASAPAERPRSDQRPAAPALPPAASSGGYQNAVVLIPEVKIAITDEVKAQILAEQVAATTTSTSAAPAGDQPPAALDPKQRTFIVSTALSEQTTDGTRCSLSPGDILTRIMDTPNTNVRVTALVTGSQRNDCATGSLLAVSTWDLQDMHNDFAQKIEAGLQKLADNQGKNGMPAGPMAGRRANPDGQAQPDITASADLQQQQQDADNAEKDVNQAAAGITPSAFHPSGRRSANSEFLLRSGDSSTRISRGTKGVTGELNLIAWHSDRQQSNANPQKTAPAKPAPAPKTAPPSAAPKAVPSQAPRPPTPARNVPASVPHPAATTAPRNNANLPRPLPEKESAPRRGAGASVVEHGPDRARLPGGGSREMRANGSSVDRDRSGRVTSVTTRAGVTAKFDPKGHLSAVNFRSSKGYETEVSRGPSGSRTIKSEHVNNRGERIITVNTGPNRGYVDHSFTRNGQPYMRRTYVAGGGSYAAVYHGFYFGGRVYYGYVPGYYYAPGFYGWAYAPWGVPVTFAWGWGAAPWYGYDAYYFAPYSYYAGPAFWLTDFVIAQSLQAAFEAQAGANSSAMPRQFAPKLGAKSENEFTAVMIPAISDAMKSDPVPKQYLA